MGYSAQTGLEGFTKAISVKVLLANLAACAVLSGVLLAVVNSSIVPGFASGFLIGTVSMLWLIRIARRGMRMAPEKVERFVKAAYHLRFAAVAALFAVLIAKGILSPWPLVAGLTGSIATTVGTMIYLAKEEAADA